MADRHLVRPRDAADEEAQVFQAEVMPGVQPQPLATRLFGSSQVGCQRSIGTRRVLDNLAPSQNTLVGTTAFQLSTSKVADLNSHNLRHHLSLYEEDFEAWRKL